MSEDNIFKPTPSRRVVTASGLPLSHYFPTRFECKQFLEDADEFWETHILPEKLARDGNQPVESKPEEQESEPKGQPSLGNQQKLRRRIRNRAEKHT